MRAAEVTRPVETKTAAAAFTGGVITIVFSLAANYHWFTPPPPYLTALIVTTASTLAGYLARHTPRPLSMDLTLPVVAAASNQPPPLPQVTRPTVTAANAQPASGQVEPPAAQEQAG